jgi:acylphosphatase
MKVRAHVLVSGRVQGVFFRSETAQEARKHRVNGWARNLPDGRVEAVFEGESESVEKLIEFCRRGPPGAEVRAVNVTREPFSGEFKEFEIPY